MQDKLYIATLLIVSGCTVVMTWKYLQYDPAADFPSKGEILNAIENGAANLTVTSDAS